MWVVFGIIIVVVLCIASYFWGWDKGWDERKEAASDRGDIIITIDEFYRSSLPHSYSQPLVVSRQHEELLHRYGMLIDNSGRYIGDQYITVQSTERPPTIRGTRTDIDIEEYINNTVVEKKPVNPDSRMRSIE